MPSRFFLFQDKSGPWAPLLVLGLSVLASVVLISACMAMMSPEAEAGPLRVSQVVPAAHAH